MLIFDTTLSKYILFSVKYYLKERYDKLTFEADFEGLQTRPSKLIYEQTPVLSSENFSLLIKDAKRGNILAEVWFGGDWIWHWEVTNIRLM